MKPENNREEALFLLALHQAAAEREMFLDRECAGDSGLRHRLETLLAAHAQPDTHLGPSGTRHDPAHPTLQLDLAQDPAVEIPGGRIDRYKILERLGEGGCGTVYVAEQTEPVRRQVALKVIKLGMDTRAVVARFEAERQALAILDHPHVAKVFDAGATDSGRPYFVMELVRGIPITGYCDLNQLGTRQRLELLLKVCQAIQHAHQKGIIHRDLKPSNILVTLVDDVPTPKVIDFGIAKATEGRLADATIHTQLHQFLGTPAYMSPEQAEMSGLDIDTRSDIYSLGVLLYELLTGKTPFDARDLIASGMDAMRRTIREREPARPSTKLATLRRDEQTTTARCRSMELPRLIHLLQRDLDWIVMKCLEKDRTRRYETANDLAADLKRHLNHEPVVARPPSTAYRLQKAYRRHRIAFTAAACIFVSLIISLVFVWTAAQREGLARVHESIQRNRAEQAQRDAESQAQLAESRLIAALGLVDSLMEESLPELSSLIGATRATEGVIRSAVGMVQEFSRDPIAHPQVRLRLANLNRILGTVRGMVPGSSGLGDPQTALKFAAEALRLMEDPSMRTLPRAAWVPALIRAQLGTTYNLHALGRFDEALKQAEASLQLALEFAGESLSPDLALQYANSSRVSIGRLLRDMGRHQEALELHFLPAYEATRRLMLTNDVAPSLLDDFRTLCLNIGDTHAWLGRPRVALPFSEEGLRISETLARNAPSTARAMAFSPAAKSQVGKVLLALGEAERAESLLADSLQAATRLVAMDATDSGMRLVLCYVLGSHALGYAAWSGDTAAVPKERRRRYDLARSYFDEACQQLEALPSESARILPRHGLRNARSRVEEARLRIEDAAPPR